MTDITEPRKFLISYRRQRPGIVERWTASLIERIGNEFEVIDSQEAAALAGARESAGEALDLAATRMLDYTDFVSVVTLEYLMRADEGTHNEFRDQAMRMLAQAEYQPIDTRFWALLADPMPRERMTVRLKDKRCNPWKEPHRWHIVAEDKKKYLAIPTGDWDRRQHIERECMTRFTEHADDDCPVCRRNRGTTPSMPEPTPETQAAPGLLARGAGLFRSAPPAATQGQP
jgi:hypothetical protein